MLPRYEWAVDYIDAMCFSNTYQPQIPTAKMLKLRDLSDPTKLAMYQLEKIKDSLIASPHLSQDAKDYVGYIRWQQKNFAFFYCKKAINHHFYGWGEYEGQCDKNGNTCGEGRYICRSSHRYGSTMTGTFKNDEAHGFTCEYSSKFGNRFYGEYRDGKEHGKVTCYSNGGGINNQEWNNGDQGRCTNVSEAQAWFSIPASCRDKF
jgi:hypothetical protein